MKDKLKIGVFVNSCFVPSWVKSIIEYLHYSEYSRIVLIITGNSSKSGSSPGSKLALLPFILHKKTDALIFSGKNNSEKVRNIREMLKEVACLDLYSSVKGDDEGSEADRANEISKYGLDIMIRLGYGQLSEKILKIPACGVWSYSISDFSCKAEDTTGYYETVNKEPVTGLELYSVKETASKKKVIARFFESTISYSISLNRDKLLKRASLYIPRVVEGIYLYGNDFLVRLEGKNSCVPHELQKQLKPPGFAASLGNVFKCGINLVRQAAKKIWYSDPFSWTLLYKIGNNENFLRNNYGDFSQIMPGREKFWADPFIVYRDEKYYVFVEEFIYGKNKGHISVLELDKDGNLHDSRTSLEKPYHLSYPFVFETGGEYYMIPESGQNRTIDLYRSAGFPYKWDYVKTIMKDLNAVDTTLFYHDNKWWLFTLIENIESTQENSPELYLYYAGSIFSDNWSSHPMNPVVTDVRKARPAGGIFVSDGIIYRPGQDCAERYGRAFSFNRITKLSTTEYHEEQVQKVLPHWSRHLKGAHTFNTERNITIIDAYKYRRRFF